MFSQFWNVSMTYSVGTVPYVMMCVACVVTCVAASVVTCGEASGWPPLISEVPTWSCVALCVLAVEPHSVRAELSD